MSLVASEMTPADIAAVTGNNNCNNGWGGGMWGDWILLFLLFGMVLLRFVLDMFYGTSKILL